MKEKGKIQITSISVKIVPSLFGKVCCQIWASFHTWWYALILLCIFLWSKCYFPARSHTWSRKRVDEMESRETGFPAFYLCFSTIQPLAYALISLLKPWQLQQQLTIEMLWDLINCYYVSKPSLKILWCEWITHCGTVMKENMPTQDTASKHPTKTKNPPQQMPLQCFFTVLGYDTLQQFLQCSHPHNVLFQTNWYMFLQDNITS